MRAVETEERRGGGPGAVGPPLALVGPTASGKTEASLTLAERLGAEVVAIDSMAVYRGMDVGTAKPTPEQRARVRHHLLDVADPARPFSVALYQRLARAALADIGARGRRALLVGGSGLYYRAVVDDLSFPGTDPGVRRLLETEALVLGAAALHGRLASLDPEAAARIEPGNVRRAARALEVVALTGRPFSSFATGWRRYPAGRVRAAGVRLPPEAHRSRIERRVRGMMEGGLLEEVERLLDRGFGPFLTASQAIGYREAMDVLRGRATVEEAVRAAVRRTRALARRQMAWFRRDPRIRWFDAGEGGAPSVVDRLEDYLA